MPALRPRRVPFSSRLLKTHKSLPSLYKILSRVRRRLLTAESAPLFTSSFRTLPTNAESPSNPFRMWHASTATNTHRLPEKLKIPGPIPSPGEARPPVRLACGYPQAYESHLPFPARGSQTSGFLPPRAPPASAADPALELSLAGPGQLPCAASAANTSTSHILTPEDHANCAPVIPLRSYSASSASRFSVEFECAQPHQLSRSLINVPYPS